jgi:hypothetical protein
MPKLNTTTSGIITSVLTADSSPTLDLQENGVTFRTLGQSQLVNGVAITLTNQTAPDFTGIPSWARRVTVMFNRVSPNSTGTLLVQLGTSSGYETSGYGSSMTYIVNATAATSNGDTGFLAGTFGSAGAAYNGIMTLSTLGSNVWAASCNLNDSSSTRTFFGSGAKTLGGTLDRVRLYIDGTQQFDAGSINIMWE